MKHVTSEREREKKKDSEWDMERLAIEFTPSGKHILKGAEMHIVLTSYCFLGCINCTLGVMI